MHYLSELCSQLQMLLKSSSQEYDPTGFYQWELLCYSDCDIDAVGVPLIKTS